MARLGPFERAPHLAIAVSGGADSMALARLAGRWVEAAGGKATALTVDHRLRATSSEEARTVAGWCHTLGLDHVILDWTGDKPATGIQSAARAARYRLLGDWCRTNRVLHLLTAHHLEDQAETVLLRFGRESGPEGLAAMPAVSEFPDFRLLRPLLTVPKAALVALLGAEGQSWFEDPTNLDPAHTRTRLHSFTRRLTQAGVTAQDLAATASRHAELRADLDNAVAACLASAAELHAAGWCTLDPVRLAAAKPEIARRALARILVTVGGRRYPPRSEKLERLWTELARGALRSARTIGGCRVVPRRGTVLICREPAAARERISVTGSGVYRWDDRFTLTVSALAVSAPDNRAAAPLTIARLGRDGWRALTEAEPGFRTSPIPPPVRPSLPALWAGGRLTSVPHLGYVRSGDETVGWVLEGPVFAPLSPIARARFSVAK